MTMQTEGRSGSSEEDSVEVKRQGYLGDRVFIDQILERFFSGIEENLLKWQREGVSGAIAQQAVAQEIEKMSWIFKGENPAYLPMPQWNGEALGKWLLENADLPFPEKENPLKAIESYFTILTAAFMQGWQAHQSGKLDKIQWQEWGSAMRRKMSLQLVGAPG